MDLIGPYTLKGKGSTVIDFMCVTMIDPATSWFEIIELPTEFNSAIPKGKKGYMGPTQFCFSTIKHIVLHHGFSIHFYNSFNS